MTRVTSHPITGTRSDPSGDTALATVVALTVAPVKAMATVAVPEVLLGRDGVAEDRRLWLVRPDGRLVTQRDHPELVQVLPELDLALGWLRLTFADGVSVTDAVTDRGERVDSQLFGKDRSGRVVAARAAGAVSELCGEPLRLVMADAPGAGWDEGPVSILARASAEAVGAPEDEDHTRTRRFKMLVEVDGPPAYGEEAWVGTSVTIGDAVVRVTHALGRCEVIRRSPATAARDWDGLKEIVKVRGRDHLDLGVIAVVERPGRIAVGDAVRAL